MYCGRLYDYNAHEGGSVRNLWFGHILLALIICHRKIGPMVIICHRKIGPMVTQDSTVANLSTKLHLLKIHFLLT